MTKYHIGNQPAKQAIIYRPEKRTTVWCGPQHTYDMVQALQGLGTIHILRQQIFGSYLTHPPTMETQRVA